MAISDRNVSTATQAGATPLVIGKPTGVVAGDVLVASFISVGTVHTTLAGWTEIGFQAEGTNAALTILRKVAGGSEPANYSFVNSGGIVSGAIIALIGVDNGTPEDATSTSGTGSGVTLTAPTITTVTDNAWWMTFFATDGTQASLTLPSGFTVDVASFTDGAGDVQRVDHKVISPPGATGTTTSTGNVAGGWMAISVAIRPAVGGMVIGNALPGRTWLNRFRRRQWLPAIAPPAAPAAPATILTGIQKRPPTRAQGKITVAPQTPTTPSGQPRRAIQKPRPTRGSARLLRPAPPTPTTTPTTPLRTPQKPRPTRPQSRLTTPTPPTPTTASTNVLVGRQKRPQPTRALSRFLRAALPTPTIPATILRAIQKLRPTRTFARLSTAAIIPTVAATIIRAIQKRFPTRAQSRQVRPAPPTPTTPAVSTLKALQKPPRPSRALSRLFRPAPPTPTATSVTPLRTPQKPPRPSRAASRTIRPAPPTPTVRATFLRGLVRTATQLIIRARQLVAPATLFIPPTEGCVVVSDALVTLDTGTDALVYLGSTQDALVYTLAVIDATLETLAIQDAPTALLAVTDFECNTLMGGPYLQGNVIRLRALWTDPNNNSAPIDPSVVIIRYRDPVLGVTSVTYPGGGMVKESVGIYHLDVPVNNPGAWFYDGVSTGVATARAESSFQVQAATVQP